MTLKTLLFVSMSLLDPAHAAEELRALVATSRDRNVVLGVSAALVAARGHFAQVLEGPGDSIAILMRSIAADRRHASMTTVLSQEVSKPALPAPGMDLVYRGESLYVARYIAPLLGLDETAPGQPQAAQLLYLIRELANARSN